MTTHVQKSTAFPETIKLMPSKTFLIFKKNISGILTLQLACYWSNIWAQWLSNKHILRDLPHDRVGQKSWYRTLLMFKVSIWMLLSWDTKQLGLLGKEHVLYKPNLEEFLRIYNDFPSYKYKFEKSFSSSFKK